MRNIILILMVLTMITMPVLANDRADYASAAKNRSRAHVVGDLNIAYEQQYRIKKALLFVKEHPDWNFEIYVNQDAIDIKCKETFELLEKRLAEKNMEVDKLFNELKDMPEGDG